jgi:signal transduction histidine kinase
MEEALTVLSSRVEVGALAGLGHDLRTPLSIINGYAQMLRTDELSPEQRAHACDLILQKCEEMNGLIRGFLESRETELRAIEQTA